MVVWLPDEKNNAGTDWQECAVRTKLQRDSYEPVKSYS